MSPWYKIVRGAHLHLIRDSNGVEMGAMEVIAKAAKLMMKKIKNRWARVCGPGAAMVMTCIRIGWEVISSRHLVTHDGEHLDLKLDPPTVILLKVVEAVKRWRWKRIENVCPSLRRMARGEEHSWNRCGSC